MTITMTITIILIRRVLALTSAAAQWHIRFPMERTWARRRCRILILDTVIETIFGIIIKRTFETSSIYASSLISIIIIIQALHLITAHDLYNQLRVIIGEHIFSLPPLCKEHLNLHPSTLYI